MTNINIDQLPKQFCENVIVGSNNQVFILVPLAGVNVNAFAITPEHAKNLAKTLTEHVSKFEANVRKIQDISDGIPSPIQVSDIPPGGGSK